jgi:hypothetical protein
MKAIANAASLTAQSPEIGQSVELCLVGQGSRTLKGQITRVAKAGSRRIHASSLTHLAGGDIAVSANSMEAEEPYFDVNIMIADQNDRGLRHGMTAVVSLGGVRTPLGVHLYRRILLFLNKLQLTG